MAGLFGGGNDAAPVQTYKPYAFNSTGLTMDLWKPESTGGSDLWSGINQAVRGGGGFNLNQTPEMKDWLSSLSGAYGEGAKGLEALLPEVSPAFGNLSKAALANIENQRLRTIGDLKENLSRRRIAGSSFAGDAAARTDAEFAQKKAEVGAQMKLAEIDTTTKLLQAKTEMAVNQFKTFVDQANFESGLAAQISSGVSTNMAANAQMAAQINAQNTANKADFLGTLIGMGTMAALL